MKNPRDYRCWSGNECLDIRVFPRENEMIKKNFHEDWDCTKDGCFRVELAKRRANEPPDDAP
jgi:hypothetical protein